MEILWELYGRLNRNQGLEFMLLEDWDFWFQVFRVVWGLGLGFKAQG